MLVFIVTSAAPSWIAAFYFYADVTGLRDFRADFNDLTADYYLSTAVFAFLFSAVIMLLHEFNKRKFLAEILRSKAIIAEKNKAITDSIQYVKRIQNAILPPSRWLQNTCRKALSSTIALQTPALNAQAER